MNHDASSSRSSAARRRRGRWRRAANHRTRYDVSNFLGAATPQVAAPWLAVLVQRLSELGWVEGRNLQVEARWAEGRNDRAVQFAAELARAKVDLIVTWATGPALAAKQSTSAIPIVFALATDPVGSGLVAGLARPGGNATGLSAFNIDLIGKRVELLREIVPELHRLAILGNVGVPDTLIELREVTETASKLGLDTTALEIRSSQDIAPALSAINSRTQALFVVGDPLTFTNWVEINSWAHSQRMPTMYAIREFVAAGGLMSYGTNFPSLFRRAAELSDKILRGTKPADMPVEQPTRFDLS